ncbi:hypothetical protein ACF08N_37830 [Streptomyces sp. NPDC015127]|uniref:hypothetical protein n=1 Tax=Streptomyces sp. NPDC015127 TaxID=3364939 RepID=UPI0036F64D0D
MREQLRYGLLMPIRPQVGSNIFMNNKLKAALPAATLLLGSLPFTAGAASATQPAHCVADVKAGSQCFSSQGTAAAYSGIKGLSWHPKARSTDFSFYPSQDGARLNVSFSSSDRAVGEALKEKFGSAVYVKYSGAARFQGGRTNDASSHWGGAAIDAEGSVCSSGFSVKFPNGTRGSVTAAHCYENGIGLASGNNFFGWAYGKSEYPSYDMMHITGGGSYTNKIYTDPGSPISRTVTGKGDPALNSSVCTSGRLTKAVCGGSVVSLTGQMFQGGGWTTGLITIYKPFSVIGQVGDSGGPVYSPSGTSGATIRGMIVGGSLSGDVVFAEKVSQVESHLGVTVLTTA